MHEYATASHWGVVLAAHLTLLILLMSPRIPFQLWHSISKRWAANRSRMLAKKSRRSEERLKRYWEIDMRRFK